MKKPFCDLCGEPALDETLQVMEHKDYEFTIDFTERELRTHGLGQGSYKPRADICRHCLGVFVDKMIKRIPE